MRHYGADNGRQLAEQVCKRGNDFYGAWVSAQCPAPFSFDELHEKVDESETFTSWMQTLTIGSVSYREAVKLQTLKPMEMLS